MISYRPTYEEWPQSPLRLVLVVFSLGYLPGTRVFYRDTVVLLSVRGITIQKVLWNALEIISLEGSRGRFGDRSMERSRSRFMEIPGVFLGRPTCGTGLGGVDVPSPRRGNHQEAFNSPTPDVMRELCTI